MNYTIAIERPAKVLSPNSRAHWSAKAKAKKLARRSASFHARLRWGMVPPLWAKGRVRVEWIMPNKAHHPDPDNAIASLKAWLDGFSDWGIVVDDKDLVPVWGGITVQTTTVHHGEYWPNGCVVLTFEEVKP